MRVAGPLVNSYYFRIAEKCFQSDVPPVRERRIVAKGLKNAERDISIIPEKV